MTRIASFHLVREPVWQAPAAMARLGTDLLRLRGVPGLRFRRLLGTGRGSSTAFGIDPARTALFAVWEEPAALDEFLATSPVANRWGRARECWSTRLALLAGHGSWGGVDVLDGLRTADGADATSTAPGPVAVLTRATVRPRAWHRFRAAAGSTSEAVNAAPGLLAVVGIGEAPVGLQATFSLWRDAAAMRAFAYRSADHLDVVRRTRSEHWYGEELFARFRPVEATGTWNGRDPLR